VALGLTPVTVCTDFLKPGGYARGRTYFHELSARMDAVGARTIPEFVARAYALESGACDRVVANTRFYVDGLAAQRRYSRERHGRPPRKIGRSLRLLDCVTCDKCVPVCPNDANFAFVLTGGAIRRETVWRESGRWVSRVDGALPAAHLRQFASFADLCNDCGNCDVFCPEDGGPHRVKPRFFGSADAWRRAAPLDGFFLGLSPTGSVMMARIGGDEYSAAFNDDLVCYAGDGFAVEFDERDPPSTLRGDARGEIDLTVFHLMNELRKSMLEARGTNFVNSSL
jgi:putative selenate reductase